MRHAVTGTAEPVKCGVINFRGVVALAKKGRARADRHKRPLTIPVARETGLEPATSGVTGRRSNQLSYSRFGGGEALGRATRMRQARRTA